MPALLELLAWAICGPVLLALTVYSVELATGLVPAAAQAQEGYRGAVTLLIPAHNESAGIEATIDALRAVAPPGTDFLVVADNCTDSTAASALAAGARVIEREDSLRRGKGYALAFGRDHLAASPPDVVIVVDADCRLSQGSIQQLAAAASTGKPAQAANLIIPDREAPALVQISNFAMLIKNLVRSRGLRRVGGCALLTGTGMAFPWSIFAEAPLASGDIAEDLGLGIALTQAGYPTTLVEQALVQSQAASLSDSVAQRTRWEHGFLSNARLQALPALRLGMVRRSRALIALGLHLLVPPLALLLLIATTALILLVCLGFATSTWLPALLLEAALAVAISLTAAAWFAYGRESLTFAALLRAPLYVLWKLPIYLRFVTAPETRWQRTRRDGDQ